MGTNVREGKSPPVVFVSQLGTAGESWQPVIGRLGCGCATVTYDRPGNGDAPPRPTPNPPLPHSAFAVELAAVLDERGISEPAVVVGHSLGGNIAKVYAGRYADRVAGIVFVDSSIPQSYVSPDDQDPIDGDGPDATWVDTVAGQVEILTAPVPAVPAVVLTRKPRWWIGGFDTVPNPASDDLWQLSQRILADQWDAPRIVADTGHQIPRERPGLVAYAVDAVVRAVRDKAPVRLDAKRLAELGGSLA